MEHPSSLYLVVGVRADQSRVVLCQGATKAQATRVKQALRDTNVFESLEILLDDDQSSHELDLFSAN